MERIVRNVDYDGDGEVSFSEFLTATMDIKEYLTPEILKSAFTHFDPDKDGIITDKSMTKSFVWQSKSFSEEEVGDMIYEASGKTSINFEEFKRLMTQSAN